MYAVGNSGMAALIPVAQARLEDADPVVAEAAAWALGRLSQVQDDGVGRPGESC
jgi:epoxyqueuosine reductase